MVLVYIHLYFRSRILVSTISEKEVGERRKSSKAKSRPCEKVKCIIFAGETACKVAARNSNVVWPSSRVSRLSTISWIDATHQAISDKRRRGRKAIIRMDRLNEESSRGSIPDRFYSSTRRNVGEFGTMCFDNCFKRQMNLFLYWTIFNYSFFISNKSW